MARIIKSQILCVFVSVECEKWSKGDPVQKIFYSSKSVENGFLQILVESKACKYRYPKVSIDSLQTFPK